MPYSTNQDLLPISAAGFVFDPTDQELLLHFLINKIRGNPLISPNAVKDIDIYGDDGSWKRILEESEEKPFYFFTRLKKKNGESSSSRVDRVTKYGTWRGQGCKQVFSCGDHPNQNLLIGSKRSFTLKPKQGLQGGGRWVMHEYRLDGSLLDRNNGAASDNGLQHYVLCRVIKKRPTAGRRSDNNNNHHEDQVVAYGNNEVEQQNGDGVGLAAAYGNYEMEPPTGDAAASVSYGGDYGMEPAPGADGNYEMEPQTGDAGGLLSYGGDYWMEPPTGDDTLNDHWGLSMEDLDGCVSVDGTAHQLMNSSDNMEESQRTSLVRDFYSGACGARFSYWRVQLNSSNNMEPLRRSMEVPAYPYIDGTTTTGGHQLISSNNMEAGAEGRSIGATTSNELLQTNPCESDTLLSQLDQVIDDYSQLFSGTER